MSSATDKHEFLAENVHYSIEANVKLPFNRKRIVLPVWVVEELQLDLPTYFHALKQQNDTVTYLRVLVNIVHQSTNDSPTWAALVPAMCDFLIFMDLTHFDSWHSEFYNVCEQFMEYILIQNIPSVALRPLHAAVEAISLVLSTGALTPLHHMFLKSCLLSRMSHRALPLLATPRTYVSKEHVSVQDVQLYYYYSGLVAIVQKEYQLAFDNLLTVLAVPSQAASPVSVQAYMKLVLIALIHHHAAPKLRDCVDPALIEMTTSTICKPYTDLLVMYEKHNEKLLEQFLNNYRDRFINDGNEKLVRECLKSLRTHNIARLTITYLTLSLDEIAEKVGLSGPQEAERLVLQMIENGGIYAKINKANGTVSFEESPEQFTSQFTTDEIHLQINALMKVNESISLAEGDIDKLATIQDNRDRRRQRSHIPMELPDSDFDDSEISI